ncbi:MULTISPECIES: RluA family pseudouridine synthase [Kytococcus]|uniref:Pseudouridine synthase n=1 Tax=Kytococcus schroeteri TaxID=138300 RepID=A0A2I1P867_9MICO|nr:MULTISPECIES: RluA family pseudouridine synthase [Kytococcus]OFS14865.1 RNA pseudouridine synthase [Kytococcus sp. HMSC28H12]PKZ40823.1 RluA family pseudouridine synthase [Kytococcus schroeteri]
MSDTRTVVVPDGLDGERVDAGLSRLLGLSRNRVADVAAEGGVVMGSKALGKGDRLLAGELVTVTLPAENQAQPVLPSTEPIPGMRVVHEDTEIIVVDKPAGVAAHPSVGWKGPDVVGGLAAEGYRISTSGAAERQGIVQRLDVGTSGLMVVAKSERAYTVLKQAFRDRTVEKTYHTVVQGLPDPLSGTIDAPIGRHPGHDYRFAVMSTGRPSITHYELLEAHRAASLLEVHLETGRTHQIRVHFSAMGHPCAGDPTYGADPTLAKRLGLERQWLHAVELGFTHPGSGEWVTFTSEYPDDLQAAIDQLRG